MGTLTMAAIRITAVLALAGLAQCSLPRLDVYYESLCPYSRQFIREEVFPAYSTLADYFDVFFIAYGNSDTTGDMESGFSIQCQHGERECVGNVVQACTVKYQPDMWSQVYLMNCMAAAGQPEIAGPACFQELGIDYDPVQACAESQEGQDLHYMNGEIHHSLSPSAYGVPWPTWDGVGGDPIIDEMDTLGLVGYLCKYFYQQNLPGEVCQGKLRGKKGITIKN